MCDGYKSVVAEVKGENDSEDGDNIKITIESLQKIMLRKKALYLLTLYN